MPNIHRRAILGGLAAATVLTTTHVASAAEKPDAELIALGEELKTAHAAELAVYAVHEKNICQDSGERCDAAYQQSAAIADKIEAIDAMTLDGLRVKARAIDWLYHDDPVLLGTSTDMRLAAQIVRSLLGGVS